MRGWLLLHHAYQDELHYCGQLYVIAIALNRQPPIDFAGKKSDFRLSRKGN